MENEQLTQQDVEVTEQKLCPQCFRKFEECTKSRRPMQKSEICQECARRILCKANRGHHIVRIDNLSGLIYNA